jgi:pimeloyl-ACP methyl ester carboxylesterase
MKQKLVRAMGAAFVFVWPICCNAQLNFPSSLRNELDLTSLDVAAREVVVLIHGWTGKSTVAAGYNRYEDSVDSPAMFYLFNILKVRLAGSSSKLVTYHWEKDASTGSVDPNPLNGALVQDAVRNSTVAANRAVPHGKHLASLLHDQAPELRRVHLIAHSAGAWAARQAAIELLQLNPYVVIQVTLCDPYIPGAVPFPWTPTTTLVTSLMDDMIWISGSSRIYRLENYYADDVPCVGGVVCWNPLATLWPTLGTQTTFVWSGVRDINLQVDWGLVPAVNYNRYYDYHSGPIEFYADTVAATISGQSIPIGLIGGAGSGPVPFEFTQIGWYRSLTAESAFLPHIITQPRSQIANPGQLVTLNVVATSSQALGYQWYRNGTIIIGAESASYNFTASASSPTTYAVRVSNATGPVFSDKAVVSVYASVPAISSISPATLGPSPSPQLITILGSNFKGPADPDTSKLIFYDPANNPTPLRTPNYVNSGRLDYNATLPVTGTWKVKIVNGEAESLLYSFTVSSGTVQLTGLSITGPGTINENTSGQFTAKAIFTDGTTPTVTASWNVSSGPLSISPSGLLSAGSVGENTTVTVTASYTSGSITKTTTANVTIVDTGSGGGYELQQLITNGDFASAGR